MLENGADIRYIQELLGRSELKSTQLYTQVSIQRLRKVHADTHTDARLERKPMGQDPDGDGGEP